MWPPARKLDAIAADVAREWGISVGHRFPMARYSFAGPAGDGAVLKIAPLEDDEADLEADALAAWGGDGAVRLLRHDRARRALLIERCIPGDDASTLDDDAAIGIALDVGRRLWKPVANGPFPAAATQVARWLDEPEFDVVTLLWNPVDAFPTRERTERRIAAFAAAGLDERRVRDWAVIRGTYLALPLRPDEDEATAPQLAVVRMLLEG